MNLYRVVSEELTEMVWDDQANSIGHEETYRIAELVVARSPSQAKWLAWKREKSIFTGTVTDMPRFSCIKQQDKVKQDGACIVSQLPEYQESWGARCKTLRS